MIKNKLDYKLVNLALIALIVFLIYQTGSVWTYILGLIVKIGLPFLFAFALAYAIYPFLEYMESKNIPKGLGICIIMLLLLALSSIVIYLITTIMWDQLSLLFNNIIAFVSGIDTTKLDINIVGLESNLTEFFKGVLTKFSDYVSDGAINVVNTSIDIVSKIFIVFASFIYFLIDMDKIRKAIKYYFSKKTKKIYNYVKTLDIEMKKYLSGLVEIIIITLVEYTFVYTIIGHPNAILLGFLAAVANLIPYFGGIIVNIIAFITAIVISPALMIKTVITFAILSMIDGYVINPVVYGKTNNIHPILTIVALFAGGILFGILGIFISFPLTIIIVATIKYFKKDIKKEIKKIENK